MSRVLLLLSRTSYRAEAFVVAARRLEVGVTVGSNHRQALADLTPGGALTLGVGDVDRSVAIIVRFASDYPLTAIVAEEMYGKTLPVVDVGPEGFRKLMDGALARVERDGTVVLSAPPLLG